ncbi:hypothetical protein O181_129659, partial [Austropuccinia psidii MF-1]|nr:hypothetical protein [Austropuccinia psidii MF-1]
MGDPFFNLYTVYSTVIDDPSPDQCALPVFLASTSPTSHLINCNGSPLPLFVTALTILASPTNSNSFILSESKSKHDFGIVFAEFHASVTNLGYLMEVTYSQACPPYTTNNLLET